MKDSLLPPIVRRNLATLYDARHESPMIRQMCRGAIVDARQWLKDAANENRMLTHARGDVFYVAPMGRLERWLKHTAPMQVAQEQTLAGEVQRTGRALPMTKPGDPIALRGVPVLGVLGGVIRGTQPEHEALKRIGRFEDVRDRADITPLPRAVRTASAPTIILVDELNEAMYRDESDKPVEKQLRDAEERKLNEAA